MQSTHTNAEAMTAQDSHLKLYRLIASSIVRYEAIVEAKNEDEAWEKVSEGSKWQEIEHVGDWQDEKCEEVGK